ncbi:MAG: hypothetical protein ACYTG2_18420 [Planctomycetota bacterium]|jgi:hypothetical protein
MNAARPHRPAAAALLALGLAGCMSYRLDLLPEAPALPPPPPPSQRVTASYTVHTLAGSDYQFSAPEGHTFGPTETGSDLAGVLISTGWFRSVTQREAPGRTPQKGEAAADATSEEAPEAAPARTSDSAPVEAPPAELHLECVLTVRTNDFVLLASGVTMFAVPTWRRTTYELIAEAQRADGTWKRYVYADATRDIHWLPILLVMSFRPWGEAYGDLRRNMYRTLVADMHADGLLQPVPNAP